MTGLLLPASVSSSFFASFFTSSSVSFSSMWGAIPTDGDDGNDEGPWLEKGHKGNGGGARLNGGKGV